MKPTKVAILLTPEALLWLDNLVTDLTEAKRHDSFSKCAESLEVFNEVQTAARFLRKTHDRETAAFLQSKGERKPINWCRLCGRVIRGPISPNVERSFCDCSIPKVS